jgi:flavodoxin
MKNLVVCFSYHHKNTEKIASVLAKTLEVQVKTPSEVDSSALSDFDLVGFGSGISFGNHYKELLDFVDKIPTVTNKKAFIFSTSGQTDRGPKFHRKLREKLESKGFGVVGEFNCAGFDTYGLLKIAGGIQKGHPDEADLKKAEAFAQSIKQQDSFKPNQEGGT